MAGRTLDVRDPFSGHAKQQEVLDACADNAVDEILVDGAIRSGKTQICARVIRGWALAHSGGLYLVCRRTYPELEDSTMRVFLNGDGGLPPVIPQELIANYNVSRKQLRLVNGSTILFRALEDDPKAPLKIRNITLSAIFIDQLEEFDLPATRNSTSSCSGRLSHPIGPRKMLAAANPSAIEHWAHRHFVEEHDRRRARVHVTLFDNEKNLEPDFVAQGKAIRADATRLVSALRARGVGGVRGPALQDVLTGAPRCQPVHGARGLGDHRGHRLRDREPVLLFCGWRSTTRPVVGDRRALQEGDGALRSCAGDPAPPQGTEVSPSFIYLDPSAWARQGNYECVALELHDLGILAMKAQNERLGGWARIEELLSTDKLKIFGSCTNLIRELPSLRYKEGSDDVDTRM